MKINKRGWVRSVAIALLLLIPATTVMAVLVGGYDIVYNGVTYDFLNNTSTFSYTISGPGDVGPEVKDLSHWVLGLCQDPEHQVVDATIDDSSIDSCTTEGETGCYQVGSDGSTNGIYGIKWDETVLKTNIDGKDFTVTLSGLWAESSVDVVVKTGGSFSADTITGPSCSELDLDYGDAPDASAGTGTGNYETTAADNGPSHVIAGGLNLGSTAPDADDGTLQNVAATADDNANTDDEDGVSTLPTITTGSTSVNLDVSYTNSSGSDATLACWIDFNRDGDFTDTGERASAIVNSSGTNPRTQTLTFSGFATPVAGDSYIRCRIANNASEVANPTGAANTGEVEDFLVTIQTADLDYGDLPEDPPANYPTTLANDGARHVIGDLYLGQKVDAEIDGQPDDDAGKTGGGDDGDGNDDEDGVERDFTDPWLPTNSVALTITVTGDGGYLVGWFDWNVNGYITDTNEMVDFGTVVSGTQSVALTIDSSYTTGDPVFSRFRLFSGDPGAPEPTGQATNGEVEDYFWEFDSATAVTLSYLDARPLASGFPAGLTVAALAFLAGTVAVGGVLVRRRDS